MHVFSFVVLSSVLLFVAFRLRNWLPINFFLAIILLSLWSSRISRQRSGGSFRSSGRPWRSRSPSHSLFTRPP
jgi:hypothetical protein